MAVNEKKIARFQGGPLDGSALEIDADLSVYSSFKHIVNPSLAVSGVPQDPIERLEFTYREEPEGSGNFILDE
ncbi:hypothetical protein V9K67_11880 [Paraflavisolibacter sp. H34]|uniref:hypothetical protein n=1 Tax=Huijunlia imazamoxiresistens TaxID=3127457 RepID=UPI00301A8485